MPPSRKPRPVSDLAAVLIVSAAPLVGMVLIGLPWLAWSKRRKAKQDSQHIVALLEWVDELTVQQMDVTCDPTSKVLHTNAWNLYGTDAKVARLTAKQRVRNRKRERQTVH